MAEFSVNTMFSDNMVLQRDKPIIVWGTGKTGDKITVSIDEIKKTAEVDKDGCWRILLEPLSAGGPFQVSISTHDKTIKFENVMVGEVWICSGQSNMQWRTADVLNAEEEIQKATDYADVRLYLVPKFGADHPRKRLDTQWNICSPETAGEFSAIAYFFARELKNSPTLKNVPIGLIDSSYGGTMVEAWISSETLQTHFPDEELRDSLFGWKPSSMYNGMIAPLIPFQLRGFLWYQGESNCGKPAQYARLFPAMIESWRKAWDQPDIPFILVQLPNHAEKIDGFHYTWLREAQDKTAKNVHNAYMAVTIDTSDGYDLHPKDKRDVAYRLALIARNKVYGEDVPCFGPVYKHHEIIDSKVRVAFDHVEGRLVNKSGENLRGFSLAGADGRFWYADATIDENQILLNCPRVASPKYIRYAWEGNPDADLYNDAALPAAPFRTDTFPVEDMEIYLIPASRSFTTPHYEVLVDGNGWVLNLKVKGQEFLEPLDSSGMPGCCFFNFWGATRLLHIHEVGPQQMFAEIETASILFEFFEDNMKWTLHNKLNQALSYFIIFSDDVEAVKVEDERIQPCPLKGEYKDTTWYKKDAALRIVGDGIFRQPLNEKIFNQVWELPLKAEETKEIELSVRTVTDNEQKQLNELKK